MGSKRGLSTEKAKAFVALPLDNHGNLQYLKMGVIKQASVKKFDQSAIATGSPIRSDGYPSYIPALEEYTHEHKTCDPKSGILHRLHVVVSHAKEFLLGTYYGLSKDHLQPYLDEFAFRFSDRSFGAQLI